MKPVSQEIQDLSIASLQSTYQKLSHAYISTAAKGSSTTLIEKRLHAVGIGLESLQNKWNHTPFDHTEQQLLMSKHVLQGIVPSIETQIARAREGSPQKTLNERRLTALQLAIESLEDRLM